MRQASQFSMAQQYTRDDFSWMLIGLDEDYHPTEKQLKQYIRDCVMDAILGSPDEYRASPAYIYRVWRRGWEFEIILAMLKEHFL